MKKLKIILLTISMFFTHSYIEAAAAASGAGSVGDKMVFLHTKDLFSAFSDKDRDSTRDLNIKFKTTFEERPVTINLLYKKGLTLAAPSMVTRTGTSVPAAPGFVSPKAPDSVPPVLGQIIEKLPETLTFRKDRVFGGGSAYVPQLAGRMEIMASLGKDGELRVVQGPREKSSLPPELIGYPESKIGDAIVSLSLTANYD